MCRANALVRKLIQHKAYVSASGPLAPESGAVGATETPHPIRETPHPIRPSPTLTARIIKTIAFGCLEDGYKPLIALFPVFVSMFCLLLPFELFWFPKYYNLEIERQIHQIQENSERVVGSLRRIVREEVDTISEVPTTWVSIFLEISFSLPKETDSSQDITESNDKHKELESAFSERNVRNVAVIVDRSNPKKFYIPDYAPISYPRDWVYALAETMASSLLGLLIFAVTLTFWYVYFGGSNSVQE